MEKPARCRILIPFGRYNNMYTAFLKERPPQAENLMVAPLFF